MFTAWTCYGNAGARKKEWTCTNESGFDAPSIEASDMRDTTQLPNATARLPKKKHEQREDNATQQRANVLEPLFLLSFRGG